MAWRKWLVRGLVLTILGAVGAVVWLYLRWTNPAAIRQQVLDKLSIQIPGAVVTLDSARMRLLGGIAINELRLARRDDPNKTDFAYLPSAIVYHNKEQLLDGKLAIRKVELYRPKLRLVRASDGRWNLAGLFAPGEPDTPIPTVVIQEGTIVIEDFALNPSGQAVELKNVNVTLLNDPLPRVAFKGAAKVEPLGALQFHGTWQRTNDALALSVEVPALEIQSTMVHCLSTYLPKLSEHFRELEGKASLQADIGYQPGNVRPWSHDVRCRLTEGRLHHPQIPLPLDQIEASARCLDGELKLERLTAQSGPSRIELKGWARLGGAPEGEVRPKGIRPTIESLTPEPTSLTPENTDFEGELKVEHLEVGPEVFKSLPANLQKLNIEYAPHGPIDLTFHFSCIAGEWKRHYLVHPLDLTCSFWRFPYPLEHITGTLDQEIDTRRHIDLLKVDLTGLASGKSVFIRGNVDGEGSEPAVDIKIWGDNLTIDSKLTAALPPEHQKLARTFQPAGQLNFQAFIRKPLNIKQYDNRYLINFHDTSVRYDVFPYPLEGVSGVLDVQEDHWEFRDFRGAHKGGEFRAHGRTYPGTKGERVKVEISGLNILFDSELEAALDPDLKKTWRTFSPSGRMNFKALVDCLPDQPPDVDVTVTALGCAVKPSFFAYQLNELTGSFRYAHRWVYLEKLRARHGNTVLAIDEAKAYLKPEGGYWVDLVFLRGAPIVLDDDLLHAVPPVLSKACKTLRIKDPISLKTHLTVDAGPKEEEVPVIFWDGEVAIRNATLFSGVSWENVTGKAACRGRYNGKQLEGMVGNVLLDQATILKQPFRTIQTQIEVPKETPDVLILPGLRANVFGGEVYGPIRLEFGQDLKYELNMTASQVKLEDFGKHNLGPRAPLSGLVSARLYLTGQGEEIRHLKGRGSVDIPNGRLYNLPLLLDLLKFLGLRIPDHTAFEEAHATYVIDGPLVKIDRLDLYGNSISLRGHGEMNLDGSDIDLEFYAVWARVVQMLPPIIKDIPPAFSKHLLKIKMKGRFGDVRCTKEPVPVLLDPIKEMLEVMSRRRLAQPQ